MPLLCAVVATVCSRYDSYQDSAVRRRDPRGKRDLARQAGDQVEDKGLKKNAISFLSNIVIGVASTAPALQPGGDARRRRRDSSRSAGPAIMIVAFVPMLFIAAAYYCMNRADPDCGTTFSWVTRAMGPRSGWMGGWAIVVTDIIVMPNLAAIAGPVHASSCSATTTRRRSRSRHRRRVDRRS